MDNKLSAPLSTLQWVNRDSLKPNDYNPNKVSKENLKLLIQSILTNGWTLPIVVRPDMTIIDGFHRWTVAGMEPLRSKLDGKVPVVVVKHEEHSEDIYGTEEMYKNGMKLVDIAKKLDVPDSTVRRWKSTQNWDGKTKGKKNERSQKKKTNARHKGGQPGNRNAVGNKGGPLKPGDKIAEKHGAYSSVYWDVLDEAEKDMIEDIPMDEEMLLIEQIQLFAVRERRIMIAINKYRSMKGEVSLYGFNRSESKRTFKTEEDKQLYEERIEKKVSAEERLPGDMYNMQTTMENKDNMIARLEKELSTVQSKKTKAIEALAKLRLEKQKIAGESSGNDAVLLWAEKIKEKRKENSNV